MPRPRGPFFAFTAGAILVAGIIHRPALDVVAHRAFGARLYQRLVAALRSKKMPPAIPAKPNPIPQRARNPNNTLQGSARRYRREHLARSADPHEYRRRAEHGEELHGLYT